MLCFILAAAIGAAIGAAAILFLLRREVNEAVARGLRW